VYKEHIQRIFCTCNSLDFIIKHLMCLLVPVLKMCAYVSVLTCRGQKGFWGVGLSGVSFLFRYKAACIS